MYVVEREGTAHNARQEKRLFFATTGSSHPTAERSGVWLSGVHPDSLQTLIVLLII